MTIISELFDDAKFIFQISKRDDEKPKDAGCTSAKGWRSRP